MRKIIIKIAIGVVSCILAASICLFFVVTPFFKKAKYTQLQDGYDITIYEGDFEYILLDDYIKVENARKKYDVESTDGEIVNAIVDGEELVVEAYREGNAVITVKIGNVSIEFPVTVMKTKVATTTLQFSNQTLSYNASDVEGGRLLLAPKSNPSNLTISYEIVSEVSGVTITNNELVSTLQEETNVTIRATYTNEASEIKTVEFTVNILPVVDTTLPTFSNMNLEYDLFTAKDEDKILELAPNSNTHNVHITYALEEENEKVSISGNILSSALTESENLTIVATYDGGTAKFTVFVTVKDTTPKIVEANVQKDINVADNSSISLDLTENAIGSVDFIYKVDDEIITNPTEYNYTFVGSYNLTPVTETITVELIYEEVSLSYTITFLVIDSSLYQVKNGGFEQGLENWTLSGEAFVTVSNDSYYWLQADKLYKKIGEKLLTWWTYDADSESEVNREGLTGTLRSDKFLLQKNALVSFRLGGAINISTGIRFMNAEDNTVLAQFYNTNPATNEGELVPYYYQFANEEEIECYIEVYDEATSNWGVITLDDIFTYSKPLSELEGSFILAIDSKADYGLLNRALENAIEEQGDYTNESYQAYCNVLTKAREKANKTISQAEVDSLVQEIENITKALELREPKEITGLSKHFTLKVGANRDIVIADYVDSNGLSLAYEVAVKDSLTFVTATLTSTMDKLTLHGESLGEGSVQLIVKYNDAVKLVVEFSVTVNTVLQNASVIEANVIKNVDLYDLTNEEVELNLSANIIDNGNSMLYAIELPEEEKEDLTDNKYTLDLSEVSASDVVKTLVVKVYASHDDNNLSYTITLNVLDTRSYRVKNGTFSDDLTGWTVENNDIGGIIEASTYWAETVPFNNDGKFFSAYTVLNDGHAQSGNEAAKGSLTSSNFVVGGSCYMTYQLGGGKNYNQVYVEVYEVSTSNVLAKYYNQDWTDADFCGCQLNTYKVDLSAFKGKTVYVRFVDNAENDYGLFFVDSLITYYKEVPAIGSLAFDILHNVVNGSFDKDLYGWTAFGDLTGSVISSTTYWSELLPYNNNGKFFAGWPGEGQAESLTWQLRSSTFVLSGTGYMSVRMGGHAAQVKVYKANGTLIGQYTQTQFRDADFPDVSKGHWSDMHTYIMDMSAYVGEEIYIELCDINVTGWANAFFDELVTYYKDIPSASAKDIVQNSVKEGVSNGETIEFPWILATNEVL